MITERQVLEYEVYYFGGGKNVQEYPYRAFINLFRRKPDELIGTIFFHYTTKTMPNTDTQDNYGYVECHLPSENFSDVIDLLRNETPLFLTYRDDHKIAILSTSWEPIGEGEGFQPPLASPSTS